MDTRKTLSLMLVLVVASFFFGRYSSEGSTFMAASENNQANMNSDQLYTLDYVKKVEPMDYATYKVAFYSALPGDDSKLAKYAKFFAGYYYPSGGEEGYYRIAYSTRGDLDGDGVEEGVAMKMNSQGGTGQYPELVVLKKDGDEFIETASISEPLEFFYDRIVTRSISIVSKGIITVDIYGIGPNDGACCPTLPKEMKFKFVNNKIEAVT